MKLSPNNLLRSNLVFSNSKLLQQLNVTVNILVIYQQTKVIIE